MLKSTFMQIVFKIWVKTIMKAYFSQRLYCDIKWESIVFIKIKVMLTINYQGSCYTCTDSAAGYITTTEGTTEISLE